jgi:hypothetical protein
MNISVVEAAMRSAPAVSDHLRPSTSANDPDGNSSVTGARWKADSARPISASEKPRFCKKMIQIPAVKLNSLMT